ncbi:hypothetical protein [Singulisphaera acidiphila]|uniref:hypothetical protein n=1 Tax=Singulisphaera acidiphila TaxID=466153 RepID=UPI0003006E2C|nr:hypothetical protein [Singulisphaera acidiphila]
MHVLSPKDEIKARRTSTTRPSTSVIWKVSRSRPKPSLGSMGAWKFLMASAGRTVGGRRAARLGGPDEECVVSTNTGRTFRALQAIPSRGEVGSSALTDTHPPQKPMRNAGKASLDIGVFMNRLSSKSNGWESFRTILSHFGFRA